MGRIFKPKYAWTKADGTRVEKQTKAWYIEYAAGGGRWVRRKAGLSKEMAQQALNQAQADVLAEKNGLPVRKMTALACQGLAATYLAARRPHVAQKQMVILSQRIQGVLRRTKAVYLQNLTPEAVEGCLEDLAKEGLSLRTQNGYLQAVKGMLNWAVRNRKIPYNPLDCVPFRKETVKRRVRRALTEEEIKRLFITALDGPVRRRLKVYQNRPRKDGTYKQRELPIRVKVEMEECGRRMALAYRIMLETGLRKSELRSLAWSDLDLEAGTLTTRPEWEGNKNRRRDKLPLPPGLLDALRGWRKGHPGGGRVVQVTDRMLRSFNEDLAAAGIAKKDEVGRVVDLHSLRHTYGTRLVAAGVDIKTVQTLMRHSSPELTLAMYVHTDAGRLAEAVRRLPG